MNKTVTITKDQFMASLGAAAYMIGKTDFKPIAKMLTGFNKEMAPRLKDDWTKEIILTDYEESKYRGGNNE